MNFSIQSTASTISDLSDEEDLVWTNVSSANTSRASAPPSLDGLPEVVGKLVSSGRSADGTSIAKVPTGSEALNIRAHAAAEKARLQEMIAEQNRSHAQRQGKQKQYDQAPFFSWIFKVIPIYNWTQRKELYNAVLKAQIQFNKSTTLVRLQQTHIDYLDALSKSSLSPERQREEYKAFQKALQTTIQASLAVVSSEEFSIGRSPEFAKHYASSDKAKRRLALQSEQTVQRLLKEVQRPHAELRHNIAQVLQYRRVALSRVPKNSPEAKTLREEVKMIIDFVNVGGMTSLHENLAKEFNELFRDASKKYQLYRAEQQKFENSSEPRSSSKTLDEAKAAFKDADAAVMDKIRRLRADGPLDLKKELIDHLEHKRIFGDSAINPHLDHEKEKIGDFLQSQQFTLLDPTSKEAKDLSNLLKESNEKYGIWHQLDATVNDLQLAAQTAIKRMEDLKNKWKDNARQKTEEHAQQEIKNAETVAEEAKGKLLEARRAANAAKADSEEADQKIIANIDSLSPPQPLLKFIQEQ